MTEPDKKKVLIINQVETKPKGVFINRLDYDLGIYGISSRTCFIVDNEETDFEEVLALLASTEFDAIVYLNADPDILQRLLKSDELEAHITSRPFYVTGCRFCVPHNLEGYRNATYVNDRVDHFTLQFSKEIARTVKMEAE